MDKQNKFCKTLEVVWSRNSNNTSGSKMLPRKKEIYIDDSIKKVKKSKSNQINENSTHNRVKRCLFQENKKKKVHKPSNPNKLNKKHCKHCLTNLTKVPDNLSSQILLPKSAQMVSTGEQLNNNKNTLFQKECTKNIDLPNNVVLSHKIVDQINSHKSDKSNIHLSNILSKSNTEHFEDIIESSEIICPVNKQKFKKRNVNHSKKLKIKNYSNKSDIKKEIRLQRNKLKTKKKIAKTKKNSDTIKLLNSPVIETKINNPCNSIKSIIEPQKYKNGAIKKLFKIEEDIHAYNSETYLVLPSFIPPKNTEEVLKENLEFCQPHKSKCLNLNKDNNILLTHSSEINVIPATPEHDDGANGNTFKIEYSPGTILNKYVPLIEVDQSPETQHGNNCHALIQSIQSSSKTNCETILPGLFEPVMSPTQSFTNNEVPFKIDFIESPRVSNENDNIFSLEICRKKKSDYNLSPDYFDSAKKRKKICKDGLRGKFQDLINRKKSEACIREYESNLSKQYQPKQGETALLNIIELWKEFKTFVLLCYYIDSESKVQKVLITLDSCPKNATKNSIIRIHSPWLIIKSESMDILLFVGIVHAEIVELSESSNPFGTTGLLKNNGLLTSDFKSEVLWKCKCSKETACQCLGEMSVFNYLQYMTSN